MLIWEDHSHMGVTPAFEAVTDIARYFIDVRGPKQPVRWWRVGADMPIDSPNVEKAMTEAAEDYRILSGGLR